MFEYYIKVLPETYKLISRHYYCIRVNALYKYKFKKQQNKYFVTTLPNLRLKV